MRTSIPIAALAAVLLSTAALAQTTPTFEGTAILHVERPTGDDPVPSGALPLVNTSSYRLELCAPLGEVIELTCTGTVDGQTVTLPGYLRGNTRSSERWARAPWSDYAVTEQGLDCVRLGDFKHDLWNWGHHLLHTVECMQASSGELTLRYYRRRL